MQKRFENRRKKTGAAVPSAPLLNPPMMIIAKYCLYTAPRKEEFYLDAFLAILTNKIKIEKHESKSQINM